MCFLKSMESAKFELVNSSSYMSVNCVPLCLINMFDQLDETVQLSKDKEEFKKKLKGLDMDGMRARDIHVAK